MVSELYLDLHELFEQKHSYYKEAGVNPEDIYTVWRYKFNILYIHIKCLSLFAFVLLFSISDHSIKGLKFPVKLKLSIRF